VEAVAREAAEFPELCRKFTYSGFLRTLSEECLRVLLRIEIAQTAIPGANHAPLPERIELAVRRTVNLINKRLVVHFVFPHLWLEVDYQGNVEVPLPVPFSAVSRLDQGTVRAVPHPNVLGGEAQYGRDRLPLIGAAPHQCSRPPRLAQGADKC
jgi:hypothetical protein